MKLILFHCASYTIKVAIKPWQAMNFFAKEQVLYEYSVYKDKVFSPIIKRIDKYLPPDW